MAERIGDMLLRKKIIDPAQLQAALEEQSQSNKFLGEILIARGFVSERQLLEILAEQFDTYFVSLTDVKVNPLVLKLIAKHMVWEHTFMPIDIRNAVLLIAVCNPLDMWPMSMLQSRLNIAEVQFVLAQKTDILATIEKHYGRETE